MDIIIGLERNVKTNSIKKSTLYDMVEYIKMYRSSEDITYYRKIMATARELSKQLCGSESLWLRFTDLYVQFMASRVWTLCVVLIIYVKCLQ